MKVSIFQKLIIISTVILVGNGILGYAVYVSNQKLHNSGQWVKHTEQIITLSAKLLIIGLEVESASRIFVLTNDSIYLEPFTSAEQLVIDQITLLKSLLHDNPTQQQRVDSLQFYMIKRLDFSLLTVELRANYGLNAALALISSKLGKLYSDKMRHFIIAIQAEETELLHQRVIANEHFADSYNKYTFGLLILISVFTILLVIATGKNLIINKEKQRKAEELIIVHKELVFQNDEKEKRAAELIIIDKELDFQSHEKEIQIAANKELETFSYSVSHDLRAPLRHISGYIDLLMKNNASQLNETGLRYLNTISDSAHEMGSLIDALLTFSRLSRTEIQRTTCNTNEMINQALKIFRGDMAGRNVTFIIPDLPASIGDENLLNQVWANLISNALKYSRNEEKAIIEISGKIEKDFTLFQISDNGVGFDMKYADKLFGVFQRLHKTRDFEGIGIGLANVNRIIARHGGTCRANSEEGKGATFSFSLPNK